MSRGQLTDKVKEIMQKEGFDGTVRELRLLPYMMVRLLDNMNIDPSVVSSEERDILCKWKQEGKLSGISTDFGVTEDFFDKMIRVLKVGYLEDMII